MSQEAGETRAGVTSHQVRAGWRRRSLANCWACPDDWWAPAVDAVADAVVRGRGLETACALLGRARAQVGVGIGETLDDLGELFAALGRSEPPLRAARAVAVGWSEGGLTAVCVASCEDPLTGLANLAYLRTRLVELYREARAGGRSVAETHGLVVADVAERLDPWRRIARMLAVGHALQATFTGGETLALLGPGRAAVLARRGRELESRVARLRRGRTPGDGGRVWVEDLPVRPEQALRRLEGLAG